jgi:hypothetical protein
MAQLGKKFLQPTCSKCMYIWGLEKLYSLLESGYKEVGTYRNIPMTRCFIQPRKVSVQKNAHRHKGCDWLTSRRYYVSTSTKKLGLVNSLSAKSVLAGEKLKAMYSIAT